MSWNICINMQNVELQKFISLISNSLTEFFFFRNVYCDPKCNMPLKHVYLFWVCPDMHAFEWFRQLLQSLESQMSEQGNHNFMSHSIYLTRGWDSQQVITQLHHWNIYGRIKFISHLSIILRNIFSPILKYFEMFQWVTN